MALVQTEYLYEVLARYTPQGLQGCHKITNSVIRNDVTGEVLSETMGSAIAITQQEAADLIGSAPMAPPVPTGDEEAPAPHEGDTP